MMEILFDVIRFTRNPSILLEIIRHGDSFLKRFVCENIFAPVEALKIGSDDDDEQVRFEVAINPSTPTYLLEYLCEDHIEWVSDAAYESLKGREIGRVAWDESG